VLASDSDKQIVSAKSHADLSQIKTSASSYFLFNTNKLLHILHLSTVKPVTLLA